MTSLLQASVLKTFSCLGDRCEDTCCQGWSMQLDPSTFARYQKDAPELLDSVVEAEESPYIMRKNDAGVCVKLEGGLCGIHKAYGERFLGDACHLYPRVTRMLGTQTVMTATMSCPEITRIALTQTQPAILQPGVVERLPVTIKNYLPVGLNESDALALHERFLDVARDESVTPQQIFLRMACVSRFLGRIDPASWLQASGIYFKTADALIPAAETHPYDIPNLFHALCGLIVASKKPMSSRLASVISDMEEALHVSIGWSNAELFATQESLRAFEEVNAMWRNEAADFCAPYLRRWLQMQLSLTLYPFAYSGKSLEEGITLIGMRLATLQLALQSAYAIDKKALSQESIVRLTQSLSRFLDHLGDPAFSLKIYEEAGWTKESRMRGLLEVVA